MSKVGDAGFRRTIVACGIRDSGVTSLKELGLSVTMDEVDRALRNSFDVVFGGTA